MDWIDYMLLAVDFFAALVYSYLKGRKDGFEEGFGEGRRAAERDRYVTGNE